MKEKPLYVKVEEILTEKSKFYAIRECLNLIALEIEKNEIELRGLISEKIVWTKPE